MKFKFIYLMCCLLALGSCSQRNLAYLSDLQSENVYVEEIKNNAEPKIQTDDILSISVNSMSPETNFLFNNTLHMKVNGPVGSANYSNRIEELNEGYLVDKNGDIKFPVIGKINLAGLTKEEASEKLSVILAKEYVKNPVVVVRFMNFKVTVIGEVNDPSTFTIPASKINIFEALGYAGDMTAYGKRENVLIMREKNGERSAVRLNLNNKDVLNSPYFYLQQNDIVYVEPDKSKGAQANINRSNVQFGVTVVLSLLSIITLYATNVL
ncbi:polysaccharide biosynthesis/export family protein [Pontibacter harenae]|uniref:polysaccharide biosynthesis/export family protein n=1 Tax=Pontibacter harenae TaxID=2894083 RepID=UPI001E37590A|nr:polysaccharide biosynthesis/export family protein [Pontibacter harenae]MCC9167202.1 polysaccharide biosynthesis/export family protein [Pontibacter harenae]